VLITSWRVEGASVSFGKREAQVVHCATFGILRAWHTFARYGTLRQRENHVLSLLGCLLSPMRDSVRRWCRGKRTELKRSGQLFVKENQFLFPSVGFFTLFPR